METKHSLKTKLGIKEKKLAELEAQVAVDPKSPNKESLKEAIRYLVSVLIAMGVTWVYKQYPFLGELQPDQTVIVIATTTVVVRAMDKWLYQFEKNKGVSGVGIDRLFTAFSSLWNRAKTQPVQIEEKQK
jgi:hypothetical protein